MDLSFLGEFDEILTYGRVSSKEQADKRMSLEGQLTRLSSITPRPTRQYQDVMTGDSENRPGFLQMRSDALSLARSGCRVLLVITDRSRLSRASVDAVTDLLEEFGQHGIVVYALDGGKLNVSSVAEMTMEMFLAVQSTMYPRQLSERLRATKETQRRQGKPVNCTPCYGYSYTRDGYTVNPQEAVVVRNVVQGYLEQQWTLNECCRYAHQHGWKITPQGIRKVFLNKTLCGATEYVEGGLTRREQKQGIRMENKPKTLLLNTHEAILTWEQHYQLAAKLEENRNYARRGNNAKRYPLSGLVWCEVCNKRMSYSTTVDKKYGGRYGNYTHSYRTIERCEGRKSISARVIESRLIEAIQSRAEMIVEAAKHATPDAANPAVIELELEIKKLESTQRQLNVDLSGAIAELKTRIAALQDVPGNTAISSDDFNMLLEELRQPEYFQMMNDREKRWLYHLLTERIVIGKDREISVVLKL